ncbi:tubulin-like doman-containing protein [Azospirillum sp. TSO35-2]|uniref:tubulin-like doman-containing protein n=1 Tax=Azospirillum sp. TSO35-2 TaxID=716796 RepID=UPI000D615FDD|nr:tubulin-like doman-containing protein [Azospirillum sp. TSO35-2]PWC40967.1 hypothetical protein TSO352_00535 [Azospirillum sp. TSO35-2]
MMSASSDSSGGALQPLQPTIFVALGGSGMKILMRLRRRILSTRWNGERLSGIADFPLAQFLYFDVDTQDAREENQSTSKDLLGSVVAFAPSETLQNRLDVNKFMGNRSVYPLIDEWFPDDEAIRQMDFSDGAAQVRCVSRLHFFMQSGDFRGRLESKISEVKNSLTHTDTLRKLGLAAGTKGYRVVVVASAAGGTGSGTFLDAGFLIRSLGDPSLSNVSLILLMGGAYGAANAQRVQANTVAALRELEYCMDRNHQPRFVTRWQHNDNPVPDSIAPYNEVYLIDNINTLRQSTNDPGDLYDMVASMLFADFGSSDFAQHKRSVASNLAGFKMLPYHPRLPGGLQGAITFQKSYSSFGQAVIETRAKRDFDQRSFELGLRMLESYYSLEEGRKANAVSEDDLRDVLAERLHLKEKGLKFLADPEIAKYFTRAPDGLAPSVPTFALVDTLLAGTDASLLRGIDDRVEESISHIRHHADFTQWPERVVEAIRGLDSDISGTKGVPDSSPRAKEIDVAARQVWEGWTAPGEGGIPDFIYRLIEDREKGGILFALDLMRQVRHRLTDPGSGVVDRLRDVAVVFDQWAEQLHRALHQRPLANIKELKGARGQELGDSILLQNVKPLLTRYGHFRLVALACRAAAARLQAFADDFLGKPETRGGDVVWSGLIGQIDTGRQRLAGLAGEIRKEIDLIARQSDTRTHWYVGDAYSFRAPPAPERIAELARQVFDTQFGGSRALFEKLATNRGKLDVREALRNTIHDALSEEASKLPSIIDVLLADRGMASEQLKQVMQRAAPWINADLDRMNDFTPGQIKLYVAVNDTARFKAEFGGLLTSVTPGGMIADVIESGLPGQIICYSELSGIPLDVLIPLRSGWPMAFRAEMEAGKKLPLFTHKDKLRFRNPLVPNEEEYRRRCDLASTYLKSVVFGALVRGSARREAPHYADTYFHQTMPGAWLGAGDERTILSDESDALVRQLSPMLAEAEAALGEEDWVALYALFQHFATAVYPPRLLTELGGRQKVVPGFLSTVCTDIAKAYEARFLDALGHGPGRERFEPLRARLEATLERWTREVPDSRRDPDSGDIDTRRLQPKRTILLDQVRVVLAEPAPATAATPAPAAPAAAVPVSAAPLSAAKTTVSSAAPPAAPIAGVAWRVAVGKEQLGPFAMEDLPALVADGRLTVDSLVWCKGMKGWTPAVQVEDLVGIWPADDEPPPLPDQDDDVPPPLP